MTATIAKTYIEEQIAIFERIHNSFPKLSIYDSFLAYDAANEIWDTLHVLYDIRSELKGAESQQQVMEALALIQDDYQNAILAACRVRENVENAFRRISEAVKSLY